MVGFRLNLNYSPCKIMFSCSSSSSTSSSSFSLQSRAKQNTTDHFTSVYVYFLFYFRQNKVWMSVNIYFDDLKKKKICFIFFFFFCQAHPCGAFNCIIRLNAPQGCAWQKKKKKNHPFNPSENIRNK